MNLCSRCSGELPSFAVFCPHCAQAHEPNFDELIDLTIDGRYSVYRRLGQGGLSTIFAATDRHSKKACHTRHVNRHRKEIRPIQH